MSNYTEQINRVFKLLTDINEKNQSFIWNNIDEIIFKMLTQESKDEIAKINNEIETLIIRNKQLKESGSFEKANKGGDDFFKTLIKWNNESILNECQKEIILNEKIEFWKSKTKIVDNPLTYDYNLLKSKEKIEAIRLEINLKSKYFHHKLFQIIGPIIYFHVLQYYKKEIHSLKWQEERQYPLAKDCIYEEIKNDHEKNLKENYEKKKDFESCFKQVSLEFFNLCFKN